MESSQINIRKYINKRKCVNIRKKPSKSLYAAV